MTAYPMHPEAMLNTDRARIVNEAVYFACADTGFQVIFNAADVRGAMENPPPNARWWLDQAAAYRNLWKQGTP